jgi:arylsulfatase A-like enzyme
VIRRPSLRRTACVASAIAALLLACWRPSEDDVRGLSVVLIVVDTLRADRLGLYGYRRGTSPALDDWARKGAVFERGFATSPWTLPSFGSIYTGLLPNRHGAGASVPERGARPGQPVGQVVVHHETHSFAGLDPAVPTLAEALSDHGYHTAAVVTNPFLHPIFGVARGFQEYDHLNGSDSEARRADAGVDRALAWIAAHAEQRFFLLLHLFDPHMDYEAPPPFQGRFTRQYRSRFSGPVRDTQAIRDDLGALSPQDRLSIGAAYDEEVAFVDQQIGRFLEALETRDILDRTLVLLTADHGEELFEHGGFGHGHAMHQELLWVPFVAWGSAVRPARHLTPVSLLDVAPTILAAARIDPPAAMAGVSLWPTLTTGAQPPPRLLFAENPGAEREEKIVVQWPFKMITDPQGVPTRLFDLLANPHETIDQAHAYPELVGELAARGREALPPGAAGTAPPLSDDLRERLRKLGYLR